ncbi:hypothetical protein VMCG_08405 [Cytospora schulzeri]|uniref:Xylanolytic transcriptional activator regulatory domain-containing protein n=1 Tax=Cytospora schulzeri TaxID=448051 RepID=A0A423VQX3_9PEZI|nr:hypothetical protein VMCG_08405 [Valsa malicola]
MHDRIVQLERLVMYVSQESTKKPESQAQAQGQGQTHAVADSTAQSQSQTVEVMGANLDKPIDERSECGSMRVDDSEIHYVNGEHWAAIMDNIADLKDYFDREEQLRLTTTPDGNQNDSSSHYVGEQKGALLLYGCRRSASREEILASLPPKTAVDRYISRYFNRYEAFWLDPSHVPTMWVGLLFGMICLAVMASDASEFTHGNEMEQQRLQIELYREKIVQCLIMGGYTKAGPYALETIMHYVYVEMGFRADSSKDVWYLLALEVNLAKRMGYHRDPSHFSDISPLQGEMRRRLWVTVLLGDILISSQMGMPRLIADWQCDTAEPRNLYDADFDLDSQDDAELPPARPETEHTTALGIIARSRILAALGTISDLTVAARPCNYAEVMRVDGILHNAVGSIPPPLRMRPMAASMTDSPQLIMSRLFLAHMFYKGQIMLHRRFLHVPEDAAAYSVKACLDASLGTLQIQHILDDETCPGGQLQMMRWRITSIMNHQFLTATMILCMLLQRGQTLQRDEEIKAALRKTRDIWVRSSSSSREARKGVQAVSLVLARFGVDLAYGAPEKDTEGGITMGGNSSVTPASSTERIIRRSEAEDMFQEIVGQFGPGIFDMSTLPVSDQSGQLGHGSSFPMGVVEGDLTLEEWITMNEAGVDCLSLQLWFLLANTCQRRLYGRVVKRILKWRPRNLFAEKEKE